MTVLSCAELFCTAGPTIRTTIQTISERGWATIRYNSQLLTIYGWSWTEGAYFVFMGHELGLYIRRDTKEATVNLIRTDKKRARQAGPSEPN